jgi:hypothetical protein
MTRPRGMRLGPADLAALDAALLAEPLTPAKVIAARLQVGIDTAQKRRRRLQIEGMTSVLPPVPSPPLAPAAGPPADPVEVSRLRGERDRLRTELAAMTRRTSAAEDLRRGVFGIVAEPLEPVAFPAPDGSAPSAETIIVFLSDLHWGEKVDLAAMDGLNSYNLAIARARLARWTMAVKDLATKHWSGPPPARLMVILGGDLITGEIHAELAKTNDAKSLPAVRDLAAHLVATVRTLREAVACPIEVISLAGNHGRSSMKPESKQSAETSYDNLVSDFLEVSLAGIAGVTFHIPMSPDALFSVYGWRIVATHGDRIGSRGGQGFVGVAATAARGMKRIVQDYSTRGLPLDLILMGHFHTTLQLEEGFVNGSLIGYSEYSRDGRFRPAPARQLFLSIHPRRLLAQVRWIDVGHPDEGSIYAAPPEDRPLRPRYRVQAVGVKA